MALSKATLVQRVRDLLGDTPWAVQFTSTIAATTTSIGVPDGDRWEEGAILEFQDTGEQCYVSSVSSNTLTVYRGYNGTTAAIHDGSTTPITCYRDPTFTFKRMVDSVELVMQSSFPYDYKKVELTLSYSASKDWYDLDDEALGLITVTQVDSATPPHLCIYGAKGSGHPVSFSRNLPGRIAASGAGIRFPRGWFVQSTPVHVEYAAKISTSLKPGTSNYADVDDGIQAEMIAMGAAARLVALSAVPRVTNQDINMGDSSVTPTSRAQIASVLQTEFLRLRTVRWEELRRTMPLMGASAAIAQSSGSLSSLTAGYTTVF